MPRGRTESQYDLGERRELAYERFMKGHTVKSVSEALGVTYDTALRYHKEYKDRIRLIARENPDLLVDFLENTVEALQELDQIRKHAWEDYHGCDATTMDCPLCDGLIELPERPSSVRNGYLKTILAAQEQRGKLFGLFGVKAEFFSEVQQRKQLQDKMMEFMRRELCPADRAKFVRWFEEEAARVSPGVVGALPAAAGE